MKVMEDFKKNRVKLLKLSDDVILFIRQKNETTFGVFSTELEFIFRSGRNIKVKYITNDRIQFQDGMFPAYLGTKKTELEGLSFLDFAKELQDFGAVCGYNTTINYTGGWLYDI